MSIKYTYVLILDELIFCVDNNYSILILLIINLIRWLQNITIAFLVLIGIFLFLFLFADFHDVVHPHTDDYFCTIDGICDDDLFKNQLGIIVKACLLTIIDFIWVRPITHELMITLARF